MARKRRNKKNKSYYKHPVLSFQEAYLKLFKVAKSVKDILQYQGFLSYLELFKRAYKQELKYNYVDFDKLKKRVYSNIEINVDK